jgi:iron complex outermembrane receptor protein
VPNGDAGAPPAADAAAPVTPPITPPPTTPEGGPSGDIGAARTEDVFAESIVTASKGTQSPVDAPNSTSIITEQDIRLSGITKIPELLRRLAGVDIMEVTGGQTEVSIRGFNQRLSNKTLVLVDGRSVYVDLLGATIWQSLSIGVEDLQRIEVVRGPGSALYGADAFNGVINLITKKPGEGKNGIVGGYGTQGATHGSLWASGRENEFAWRLAAGYDYLPRWSREVPNGRADIRTGIGDQVESSRTVRLDVRGSRQLG